MEEYDLDQRLPKSLDCRHALCKACLVRDGRALRKCPSCRQPIDKPTNVVNDLTMIDYLERKQQKRREREQKKLQEELRNLLETISQELRALESLKENQKRTTANLTRKKINAFSDYAKCVFKETLAHQNKNKQVMSKMASVNSAQLDARIQFLHENTAVVTSLLEQSFINQDDFDKCTSETQSIIQSKLTNSGESVENMWSVYREFLLDHYTVASRQGTPEKQVQVLSSWDNLYEDIKCMSTKNHHKQT